MPLFRDFNECKKIAVLILLDFLEEGHPLVKELLDRIKYEESSERKNKGKCYMVTTKLKKALWHNEEAVSMGFDVYLRRIVESKRFEIDYKEANP
tara:strand:- start:752 stop:1036 length:285 start_codon:yes stop_codon:yes gene_type:complete